MAALWLEFTLILCLYGTAQTVADMEGVVQRNVGESITIQCNSTPNQVSLNLKKGLNEEQDIFYKAIDASKPTIDSKFTDRLQFHGKFPKVDIVIKNLTLNDTGPYWCVYKMMDKNYTPKPTRGSGSVLLVVTERTPSTVPVQCQSYQDFPLLLSVLIGAAVVIVILVIVFIGIFLKNKPLPNTEKARQVPTNDVYEDMRGTIRR